MTFSCKVLLTIIIIVALSLRLFSAMDICKEKDKPGFQLKLLGTALFKDHLLLITRDDSHQVYTVYNVPFSKFDNSYGQMLLDIAGVPIEQYWPMLKNDTQWKEMRPNVLSIWLIDKVKPYLYFIVPEGKNGSGLDVESGKWTGGMVWKIHKNILTQWISNSDASHTYTNKINDELHNIYMMYVWNITLTETGENAHGIPHEASHLYYAENKQTKQVENITFMYNYNHGVDYYVTPENDPYLSMAGYENYRLVNLTDWNLSPDFVPPGFVFKEHFHMFSLEKVFIFADSLTYEDPGLKLGDIWYSTPVKAIAHKDYFKCQKTDLEPATYPPVVSPLPRASSSGGNLVWLWIVLAILLGLLLILLAVWMCYRGKKSKGDHHGANHKKRSIHSSGSRGASTLKRPSSRKRATSLKRNGSTKRPSKFTSSKQSHGTRRSGLKAK